jgi:DNA-binding MarR family transcriptional regulator
MKVLYSLLDEVRRLKLLAYTYRAHRKAKSELRVDELCRELDMPDEEITEVVRQLSTEGLLEPLTPAGSQDLHLRLTPKGSEYMEHLRHGTWPPGAERRQLSSRR